MVRSCPQYRGGTTGASCGAGASHSRHQKLGQFLEQRLQPGSEQRPRLAQSAPWGEGGEIACFHQVLRRDRDVVDNVIAHGAQPCLLRLGVEAPCPLLVQKPEVEPAHGVDEAPMPYRTSMTMSDSVPAGL